MRQLDVPLDLGGIVEERPAHRTRLDRTEVEGEGVRLMQRPGRVRAGRVAETEKLAVTTHMHAVGGLRDDDEVPADAPLVAGGEGLDLKRGDVRAGIRRPEAESTLARSCVHARPTVTIHDCYGDEIQMLGHAD